MDHAGVESATCWTLLLGILHECIVIFQGHTKLWISLGFVVYICFRQFIFPVSIALITSRLGFKYFGLLNGLSYLLSGLVQLFMIALVHLVQGTCHKYNSHDEKFVSDTCDHGHWLELHIAELLVLILLLLVPYYDYRDKIAHQKQIEGMVQKRSSWRILCDGDSGRIGKSPLVRELQRTWSSNGSYGSMIRSSTSVASDASNESGGIAEVG